MKYLIILIVVTIIVYYLLKTYIKEHLTLIENMEFKKKEIPSLNFTEEMVNNKNTENNLLNKNNVGLSQEMDDTTDDNQNNNNILTLGDLNSIPFQQKLCKIAPNLQLAIQPFENMNKLENEDSNLCLLKNDHSNSNCLSDYNHDKNDYKLQRYFPRGVYMTPPNIDKKNIRDIDIAKPLYLNYPIVKDHTNIL